MPRESFEEITSYNTTKEKEAEFGLEIFENEIIDKIKEVKKIGDKIGYGETAEVFVCKTNPDICYKIIKLDSKKSRVNTKQEGDFLNETCGLDKDVRVPKPFYSIKTADGFEVLIMEKLDAVSIRELIKKDLELPAGFNFQSFFLKVFAFFEKMHENKRIHHRDPHEGNIMIELSTGKPCVIDFGSAIKIYMSTDDPYKRLDAKGVSHVTTSDEAMLREVQIELRKYIQSKTNN